MKTLYDDWDTWQRLMSMLEYQFGSNCEIILHDLTKDYNHTIVDIRNGHITDRNIGDCGSNLGLEVLRGTVQEGGMPARSSASGRRATSYTPRQRMA